MPTADKVGGGCSPGSSTPAAARAALVPPVGSQSFPSTTAEYRSCEES